MRGMVGGGCDLGNKIPPSPPPVFRIHEILLWIRILDPDPAIFVTDLQDASKKLIFEGTFTLFFKDKNSKRVTK
jgi:hypothetical protein